MTPMERLRSKVDEDPNGCWRWQGAIHRTGYGTFKLAGKQLQAHRAAYALLVGEIPAGAHVCHKCDVRDCVNPQHLFVGSHEDNMADMKRKDRQARGVRHGRAKLTEAQVAQLRQAKRDGANITALGREFGVSSGAAWFAATGRNWGK